MKIGHVLAGAAALASLMSGSTQAVAAGCWQNSAIEAAQVRDFETMLMVATLRCQIKGVDLSEDYNRFVREKRVVLTAINDELRARYTGQGLKGVAALNAYDKYVTSLANAYGAGQIDMGCADFKAMMDIANAAPASRIALLDLAVRAGSNPALDDERCAPRIAMAQ